MDTKVYKKIVFDFNKEEKENIDKVETLLSLMLQDIEDNNCSSFILEYYESQFCYTVDEIERFREFLEYLYCSDNEVC